MAVWPRNVNATRHKDELRKRAWSANSQRSGGESCNNPVTIPLAFSYNLHDAESKLDPSDLRR